jgi:hypothetical protein
MACEKFSFNGGHGILCLPDIYEHNGFVFKFHKHCGVVRLRKKDFSVSRRQGNKFYKAIEGWFDLPDDEREKTLVCE